MPHVDLHQLRTFVTVAREQNLTRAAELLFLSQPAVSAHIKAAEEAFGVVLFERTPKGMLLTAAGRELLAQAEGVLAAHKGLMDSAMQIRGELRGRLRIGSLGDAQAIRLGPFLSLMAARHPAVELEVRQSSSGEILSDLRSGQLDAGYVIAEALDDELAAVALDAIRVHLAAPAAWRDRVEGADWQALLRLAWLRGAPTSFCARATDALFAARGERPARIVEVHGGALRSLVAAGMGLGLLTPWRRSAPARCCSSRPTCAPPA